MIKKLATFLCLMLALSSNAQIAKPEFRQTESQSENQVTDIVVVFKMHVDVGFTNWAEAITQYYATDMLEKTLQSIDETSKLPKDEQFVWTVSSWVLHYMLENSTPDLRIKLEKAVRDRRIIPHALPITYETEESDLESLTRGLEFASTINKRYGHKPPRDAKLTDVPSQSWVIPTLLKNAGVDFLHIGCNPGSTSPTVPTLFWWQGVDESKLLTFYWDEYYGSGILPPKDWKHKTWLAMIHTHENTGAPEPKDVVAIIKEAKEKLPGVRIHIGSMSDFYDLLMKENPELPTVRGDMPDTWIHGYLSSPYATKVSKQLQRYTYDTEILNTLMSNQGIEYNIDSYIDKAVENMVLYDEHTFGIAMAHGHQQSWKYDNDFKIAKGLGYYDYAETSWDEKAERIKAAERIVKPIMKKQLAQLARNVNIDGKRIVVFNPLPWERTGRVNLFAGVYEKDFKIYGVKDPVTNTIIAVYNDDNLISFDAEKVPAGGYKAYEVITEPLTHSAKSLRINRQENTLENQNFKLRINASDGTLSSVYDQTNKIELAAKEGFAQYQYQQFGLNDIKRYNSAYVKAGTERWSNPEATRPYPLPFDEGKLFTGKCEKIIYTETENSVQATAFCRLNDDGEQKYMVTYTLYENEPYVEINWALDGKRPNSIPEAGWMSFPFAVDNPEYRLHRIGGIVDPNKDFVENTNQDYYFLNTSMAMFNPSGAGVTINSPNSPGVSIDSKGLCHFSGKKHLNTSHVFLNMYNTQWGTNFTGWIEGSLSSKFYIWSFKNYDAEKDLITPSAETREQMYGVYYNGKAGNLPIAQKGVSVSQKGVFVTAFGNNRDGEGVVLRLWEQAGKSGKCTVDLPTDSKFKTAYPCNLRGEINDNAIAIKNNKFETEMKANSPQSFILKY